VAGGVRTREAEMNYDIIGDVHGHADVLVALLRKLGG
jgi:hypothetical protein